MDKLFSIPVNKFKYIYTAVMLIFLTVCSVYLYINIFPVERNLVNLAESQTLTTARVGARLVEGLLNQYKFQLLALASNQEIKKGDIPKIRILMSNLVASSGNTTSYQIAYVSKIGVLEVIANKLNNTTYEGGSFADRDYFQWAQTAQPGQVFVSQPAIARAGVNKGKWAFVVATPVFDEKNNFNGLIYSGIAVNEIAERYLQMLNSSVSPNIYILDSKGIVVFAPSAGLMGNNLKDYVFSSNLDGHETFLNILQKANDKKEFASIYWFKDPDGVNKKWIGAIVPLAIQNNILMVWVSVPYEAIANPLNEISSGQIGWATILGLIALSAYCFATLGLHVAHREGYQKGVKDAEVFVKKP